MRLSKVKQVSLVLLITTVTGLSEYLPDALNNTLGLPYLRFTYVYLFLLPGVMLIHFAIQENRAKFPNLIPYLVFVGVHYLMEKYAYRSVYSPDFDLIRRAFPVYFAYVALVNYGVSFRDYIKVLRIALVLLFLVSGLFYLSFIGIVKIGGLATFGLGRTVSNWNLNIISDMNILGIYITYILSNYQAKITIFKIKMKPLLLAGYFLIMLLFTATRGSIVLFIVGLLIYFMLNWRKISARKRIFYVFSVSFFTILFLFVNFFDVLSNSFFVFDRLLNASYEEEGRYLQIVASWNNFTENMWFGVGYSRAADNFFEGISRSNFQYTQILGAGGIILFSVYFYFIYKMFLGRLRNTKNLIILAMLLFVLAAFIFRRMEMYYAIIAYIVYVEGKFMKNRQIT